jgi:circadian clock protein KaiB
VIKETKNKTYYFRLYVTGASINSMTAVNNIKKFCEEHLHDDYELEIIDVYKDPTIAIKENIIALPMLIMKCPFMEKRFIGTLSEVEQLLSVIDTSK